MESIPTELLELICTFLPVRDLVAFSATATVYRDAARFVMLNDAELSLDVSMCILNHYNISFLIPVAIHRNLSRQFYDLANRIQPVTAWQDHIVITEDMRAIGNDALVLFAGSISASFKKKMQQTITSNMAPSTDSLENTLRAFVQHEYYQWMSVMCQKRRKIIKYSE
jgi:hypothetical protein